MKGLFLIFIILAALPLDAKNPGLIKKFEKELSKFFDVNDIILSEIGELSSGEELFFSVIEQKEKNGFAVLTSAEGRFDHFDFMIVFNSELQIAHLKILNYRSQYGAEIRSKRWLKQFYKNQSSDFNYGSDIQAISGATLSAQSLTQKVNAIRNRLNQHFSF